MIVPPIVFMVVGLLILGLVVAERYPLSTWKDGIVRLRETFFQHTEPVRMIPQDSSLEDLMVVDGSDAYAGPQEFPGLVDVVERAMVSAESRATSLRRSRHDGADHPTASLQA